MSAGADASELRALAESFGDVGDVAGMKIWQATEHSARSIKDAWNPVLKAEEGRSFRGIGSTVDYEMKQDGRDSSFAASGRISSIEAEIGPNIQRYPHLRASFAGWFEEGAVDRPATHAGSKALKAYEKDWRDHIADAAAEAIEEA